MNLDTLIRLDAKSELERDLDELIRTKSPILDNLYIADDTFENLKEFLRTKLLEIYCEKNLRQFYEKNKVQS